MGEFDVILVETFSCGVFPLREVILIYLYGISLRRGLRGTLEWGRMGKYRPT